MNNSWLTVFALLSSVSNLGSTSPSWRLWGVAALETCLLKYILYFKRHQPLPCDEGFPWSPNILFVFLHQPQVDSCIFVCQYHTIQQVLMITGRHPSRCDLAQVWKVFTQRNRNREFPRTIHPLLIFAYISFQKNTSGGKQLFVTSQRVQLVSQVSRNAASQVRLPPPDTEHRFKRETQNCAF